jgi:hypothetical protein
MIYDCLSVNVVQETVADFANFHRFIYLVIVEIFFDEICAFCGDFFDCFEVNEE